MASFEPTSDPGTAEIAFAVADQMHGRGVATLLLEHLVSLARERSVRVFTAVYPAGEHGHAPGVRGRRAEPCGAAWRTAWWN